MTSLSSRKADHIRINIEENVDSDLTTGLEKYRFIHQALPEINLTDIDLTSIFLEKTLAFPLIISSMTGGTEEALRINQTLAETAQEHGLGMGLGSQRAAIEHPELENTFKVRSIAPDILLFANLGAIQLNYGYTVDQCQHAVDMVEADALVLHLNPLQEALQPEGDIRWEGLLQKIETVCRKMQVPVILKEVGWGISTNCARQLVQAGVSAIDVAGAGGTSWSQVESFRIQDPTLAEVAKKFRAWGIPTAESIQLIRSVDQEIPVIASGGLRNGLDIAKSITLGAQAAGMAGPLLRAANKGRKAIQDVFRQIEMEMKICMFAAGARNLSELRKLVLIKS